MPKKTPTLSQEDVARGIYIDFEGTQNDPASLLGVLYHDGEKEHFNQYVFEEELRPAARQSKTCQVKTVADTVQLLSDLRQQHGSYIFHYSSREKTVLEQETSNGGLILNSLADVLVYAKRWLKIHHPGTKFKKVPFRGGRYRLEEFLKVIEYKVSTSHRSKTGKRIRAVRQQLEKKGGDYSRLPKGVKAGWTKMLNHNFHDCKGMQKLVSRIVENGIPRLTV